MGEQITLKQAIANLGSMSQDELRETYDEVVRHYEQLRREISPYTPPGYYRHQLKRLERMERYRDAIARKIEGL